MIYHREHILESMYLLLKFSEVSTTHHFKLLLNSLTTNVLNSYQFCSTILKFILEMHLPKIHQKILQQRISKYYMMK